MNRHLSLFTVLALLALLALSLAQADAATVSGQVRPVGRPARTAVSTIVYAVPLDGAPVQPGTFSMSQKNKTFAPHVLPVPAGSTVSFPNDDQIFHNVFSLSRPNPFDLGLYRAGSTKNRAFSGPAIYRIFCNIHPQMTAIVMVVPTQYFVEADANGNFRLDLPAGRYRLTAWSERAQQVSAEITVSSAAMTAPELSLNESGFVEAPHKNKFGQEYPVIGYDPSRDKKPK